MSLFLTSTLVYHIRVARGLRGWLLVFKVTGIQSLVLTIVRVLPRLKRAFFLGVMIVAIYSVVGVATFQGLYHGRFQNFDAFGPASLAMLTLYTTENYPHILYPALQVRPIFASIFFCSYVWLGVWVFMSYCSAIIYDFYRVQYRRELARAKIDEQRAISFRD
jgi:hypothetical protein